MSQNIMGENHPLSLLAQSLPEGEMGAVLARPGTGKTAVLVQIALYHLLAGTNVLHVSLDQSVRKVALWYEEVFTPLSARQGWPETLELWETILPHRFIMGFSADGFSAPRLMERLADLTEQNIFYPQVLLVDGLDFSNGISVVPEIRKLAEDYRMRAWFSVRLGKVESIMEDGLPKTFSRVSEHFSRAFILAPRNGNIAVSPVKANGLPDMALDPSTFLIV